MAKKKILKLTDEQYYKYIMSLKNDETIKDDGVENPVPDTPEKDKKDKSK